MQLEIEWLGSGGATTTPLPGCDCPVCTQARVAGAPAARSGPSIFVHGPQILIDTPEESKAQLNRANISTINAGLYSHWHPDHTAGSRVWESLNNDWLGLPKRSRCTPVYLPEQVAADWPRWLGLQAKFDFYQHIGVVDLQVVPEGQSLSVADVTVTPIQLQEAYVYAFLLEHAGRRVLIAMDEIVGWQPPQELRGVDLACLPMGVVDVHPLTGERLVPLGHPILAQECTFNATLNIVEQLQPKRVILAHIEEVYQILPSALDQIAAKVQRERGRAIEFAYDGLRVRV